MLFCRIVAHVQMPTRLENVGLKDGNCSNLTYTHCLLSHYLSSTSEVIDWKIWKKGGFLEKCNKFLNIEQLVSKKLIQALRMITSEIGP